MFEGEEGGACRRKARAAAFFQQYNDFCPKGEPYPIGELTPSAVHRTIRNTSSTAPSLDNISIPQETRPIPQALIAWLTKLLLIVELTGVWPQALLPTRAVFLVKLDGQPNDLTDYRVLLITSIIYRVWATCRSRKLDNLARVWATEDLLSAAPGAGAHAGHYDLAIHIEHAIVRALQYGGSCTDLGKCFDRILREVITPAAVMAGFPIKILKTYMAFLNAITIYHDYALGLG